MFFYPPVLRPPCERGLAPLNMGPRQSRRLCWGEDEQGNAARDARAWASRVEWTLRGRDWGIPKMAFVRIPPPLRGPPPLHKGGVLAARRVAAPYGIAITYAMRRRGGLWPPALSVSFAASSPKGRAKFLALSLRGGAKPRRGNPFPCPISLPPPRGKAKPL